MPFEELCLTYVQIDGQFTISRVGFSRLLKRYATINFSFATGISANLGIVLTINFGLLQGGRLFV